MIPLQRPGVERTSMIPDGAVRGDQASDLQLLIECKRAQQRLRQSEAYLAEAQRLSQTGSWAWNPATGDIRYWSEMCFCLLGFDPAGPLPRFEEFALRIHPDDQALVRERFDKAIRD